MVVTNTLAYHNTEFITTVKMFYETGPGGRGGGDSLIFLYNTLSMDPKHQNKEVKESSNYSGKPFLRPANTKIFIDFLKKTFGI
jgi:hypothetical protein